MADFSVYSWQEDTETIEQEQEPIQQLDQMGDEESFNVTLERDVEDTTTTASSQSSQNSIPEEECVWVDEIEEQQKKRQILNDTLENLAGGRVSPIRSTLNTSWEDISVTQQKYYQRKAVETISATLSVLSPGQEQELWNVVRRESLDYERSEVTGKPKSFDPNSGLICVLVNAYNEAETWQTKRQILSLFANDFTQDELMMMIPTLTKWKIEQARQHAIDTGKGQPVIEEQIFRRRISTAQIDHFVEFISRPEMVQDVAFGTKVMKLDAGDHIIIPAVVRTLIPSRIIAQYKSYCVQEDFQPAGQRSLYRMLEVCSASTQKSLQGLDNTTAEGSEAIDNVSNAITTLEEQGADPTWVTSVKQKVKDIKRYLKTEYKGHVGKDERCADHCVVHSLSDRSEPRFNDTCKQAHNATCVQCASFDELIEEITNKINETPMSEEERSRLRHECMQYIESIKAWKAHLIRTVNQEEAKQDVLSQLDGEKCMVVMDWAMKYLPQRYRERMSDFFGKRGKSWHVSAVITRQNGKYEVECFVHILDSCTQNSFAVASIVEHLFSTIKHESPNIKKVYLKSDNAGCYHSGLLILSLPFIGKRTGITPLRYDFSDPQSGKDICDRKTAPMKAHIRRWVNEKHDVITGEDMKVALESHGGVRGCRVAVVKVDSIREAAYVSRKIPGISLLNNFAYEDNAIRVWRAYDIGPGKRLTYKELQVESQGNTGLQVIQSFGPHARDLGTIRVERASSQTDIFSCCENTCVLTFKTLKEAEAHMDTGKHVRGPGQEHESVYDTVRKNWAKRVTGLNVVTRETLRIPVDEAGPSSDSASNSCPVGWALKSTKRTPRMGEKVKAFLVKKFNIGASGGHKADPVQVSKEMKSVRDTSSNLLFKPEEWRTSRQISSFFSRLSALQRYQAESTVSEDDEIDEEDLIALESESCSHALRQEVYREINTPTHPIEVNKVNLCNLAQADKLGGLKIAQLQEICACLHIEANGPKTRRRTYTVPLEAYIKTCSCNPD